MNNLSAQLFKELLLRLKVGFQNGQPSVSKPLFLLSAFDLIDNNSITRNEFYFDDALLRERYKEYAIKYFGEIRTPFSPFFIRPFYHLDSEPFYELVWKSAERPPTKSHTPSAKYLRENLEYAKLDDDLWELLQDPENRAYLKQVIIDRYFKN